MKAFLLGITAMVVISVGAMLVFDTMFDHSASTVFQSDNDTVRLD